MEPGHGETGRGLKVIRLAQRSMRTADLAVKLHVTVYSGNLKVHKLRLTGILRFANGKMGTARRICDSRGRTFNYTLHSIQFTVNSHCNISGVSRV